MTLYVTNPSAIIEARRRMMRRMFNEAFESERVLSFPVDLDETTEEYTIRALLPGLTTEEISIQFNNSILSIEGEYRAVEDEKVTKLINELPQGRFARTFELDEPVRDEKIEASMSNGVLTVRVPKAEEAKPRTIKIVSK